MWLAATGAHLLSGCSWVETSLGGRASSRTAAFPGMGYLGTRVIPRLIRSGHSQLVEAALVANPARLLARFPAPDVAAKETHG